MGTANYNAAAELNLTIKRGDTWNPPAYVVTSNTTGSFDFTGYSATMTIKKEKSDCVSLLVLSTANGKITLSTGSLQLSATSDDTDIYPGNYYYDLQLTYPDNTIKTWLSGQFKILQDVTR